MSERQSEAFWPSLQQHFGEILRHPLSRVTGTLTSNLDAHGGNFEVEFVSDGRGSCHERLAIYNRQYWFRLFSVMQKELPLVAQLLGFWEFNGWVAEFLQISPPKSIDVAGVGDGFVEFVVAAGIGRVLLDALEYDLFVAIQTQPLRRALADLESKTPVAELVALPNRVNQWLRRSMLLGFWSGFAEQP